MTKEQSILASLKQTGWTTIEKANRLYDLVYESAFKFAENKETELISVELGVFYGRSLLPMGFAHKNLDVGYAIGFDAYDNSVCVEGTNNKEDDLWWSRQDLNAAYESVQSAIEANDLSDYCLVGKRRSDEAIKQFKDDTISLLHQDSSHNIETITKELEVWIPKLKTGGFWVIDDAKWDTAIEGYAKLPDFGLELMEDFTDWQIWIKK